MMIIRNKRKYEKSDKKEYGRSKHKYQSYIIKQASIWIAVIVFGIVLFLYYYQLNPVTKNIYEFIKFFVLDILVAFIPVFLMSINIKKKFKEEKDDLKNLRAMLINLRYEAVYNLVTKYEKNIEKVINTMKQYSNPVFLSPFIIDKIIVNLRKYRLDFAPNRSYADIFNFKFREDDFSALSYLDKIIIGVIKLLKNYGEKKEYNEYQDAYILEDLNETVDYSDFRNNFLMDFGYVIVYELFFKKEGKRKLIDIYRINYKGKM